MNESTNEERGTRPHFSLALSASGTFPGTLGWPLGCAEASWSRKPPHLSTPPCQLPHFRPRPCCPGLAAGLRGQTDNTPQAGALDIRQAVSSVLAVPTESPPRVLPAQVGKEAQDSFLQLSCYWGSRLQMPGAMLQTRRGNISEPVSVDTAPEECPVLVRAVPAPRSSPRAAG